MKTNDMNANNIDAVMKALAGLTARVDRLEGKGSNDASDDPFAAALRRELGQGARVKIVSLDELFAELERELSQPEPETFEDGVARILREFGKGCGNGKPGECEDCLAGAVRAIAKLASK